MLITFLYAMCDKFTFSECKYVINIYGNTVKIGLNIMKIYKTNCIYKIVILDLLGLVTYSYNIILKIASYIYIY
jgi:hypothetical protein